MLILISYLVYFCYVRPRKSWLYFMISIIIELAILTIFTSIIYLIAVKSSEANLSKRKMAGLVILYSCFIAFGFEFLLIIINMFQSTLMLINRYLNRKNKIKMEYPIK